MFSLLCDGFLLNCRIQKKTIFKRSMYRQACISNRWNQIKSMFVELMELDLCFTIWPLPASLWLVFNFDFLSTAPAGPCDSCKNGGLCMMFSTAFYCDCVNGYSGIDCSVPPTDDPITPQMPGNSIIHLFCEFFCLVFAFFIYNLDRKTRTRK